MNYSLRNGFFRSGLQPYNEPEYTTLRTDIYEQDNTYYLKVETPGIEKENITVSYEDGYLTISVKEENVYEETSEYIRKERITSHQERTFYLGDIDEQTIKASYQNGVLTISIKKQEEKKEAKKQITIE